MMTERTIDPSRQGGTDMAPRSLVAPEMTYAEAVEYDEKFRWRSLPTRSDRARQALIAEVERLQSENSKLAREALSFEGEARESLGEIVRYRAALPDIIGCVDGKGFACRESPSSFKCCAMRARVVAAGLAPQPERQDEPGDGA